MLYEKLLGQGLLRIHKHFWGLLFALRRAYYVGPLLYVNSMLLVLALLGLDINFYIGFSVQKYYRVPEGSN